MARYLVLDTETSGLPLPAQKGRPPPPADAPGQPRLASLTALALTDDLLVDEDASILRMLVRPDGWSMSRGASQVNGLTDDILAERGLPLSRVIAIYGAMIDAGWTIVAHNAPFDAKILRGELRRSGMDDRFNKTFAICTMQASAEIIREAPTHKMLASGYKTWKMPNLQTAYEYFYGEPFSGTHTAEGDAHACLGIFRRLKELNRCPEPRLLYAKNRNLEGSLL